MRKLKIFYVISILAFNLLFIVACGGSSASSGASNGGSGGGDIIDDGGGEEPAACVSREPAGDETGIGTAGALVDMASDLSGAYILTDNISLEGSLWIPIGDESNRFAGSLDGNCYTITGLKIDAVDVNNVGLFGVIDGAEINRLALEEVDISATYTIEDSEPEHNLIVGGIAGRAHNSAISNSHSTGSLSTQGENAFSTVGGLVGRAENVVINNSYSEAEVSTESKRIAYAGGLVGNTQSNSIVEMKDSYSKGHISASAYNAYSGGIVGHTRAGLSGRSIYEGCYSEGDVVAVSTDSVDGYYDSHAGGIAGKGNGSNIINSHSTGNISAIVNSGREAYAGGISGSAGGSSVINSYSTGAINATGTGIGSAGGITGYLELSSNIIKNSYSEGDITAIMGGGVSGGGYTYAGGIAGDVRNVIVTNSYSRGAVESHATNPDAYGTYAGGIVGRDRSDSTIEHCAAINPSVSAESGNAGTTIRAGRIAGSFEESTMFSGNIAREDMSVVSPNTSQNAGYVNGEGKPLDDFQKKSTYEGLEWPTGEDVDNPWKIEDGSYPKLYWQE